MKRINVLMLLIALLIGVLTSCNNEGSEVEVEGARETKKGVEETKKDQEFEGYKIGEVAADFKLKNVDGSMVSLESLENKKGYIVTFICNECPVSKLYEDRLIKLHNKYTPKGYTVVAINSNSSENIKEGYEAMQKRAEIKGFPFPYLVDEDQTVYPKFGALRTPHAFLLDKDFKVQYMGAIDDNSEKEKEVRVRYLENAIKSLEHGQKPNPSSTKAVGCPIKARKT